ncbi:tryptophan synthase subunit alpha [cyanobiont of Ornithocercus magnificus]|nr:tryptophan synthase subunit alpha [cyanobiont of Ornithocercus magnificus]
MPGSAIAARFRSLQAEGRFALMPFLMAGDPNLETTADVLLALQQAGADMVELGIPYSDPLADGQIIQASASRALASGVTPSLVFAMLRRLKGRLFIPVILFSYVNLLFSRGLERFFADAASAGATGLIIPDLPLEEAEQLSPIALEWGLDLALLVAPTTPSKRMERIMRISRGFTYLVSVTGVTGERAVLEHRVHSLISQLKCLSSQPVVVGFGISGPQQVIQAREWGADGVIIGSALVKRITASETGAAEEAKQFCAELRQAAS